MRRWIGIGIVLLLGAGSVVALFSTGRGGTGSDAKSTGVTPTHGPAAFRSATPTPDLAKTDATGTPPLGSSASGSSASGSSASVVPPSANAPASLAVPKIDAKVVKRATLSVAVGRKTLSQRFASANDVAELLGGFIESSDASRGLATITMRVPSDRFAEALSKLGALGRVTDRSERGDDVTAQFTDLDARIRNLAAQEGVLQDLMRQARNIPDTITVQQQLSAVRQEIEQLTGQRNLLDNQASYATIALTLHTAGAVPVPATATHRNSIAQAWHDAVGVAVAIVGGTIVVLGALVPLAILALLVALGWMVVRRRRPGVSPAGL